MALPGFLAPGRVITMATPTRNYELNSNNCLIFHYSAQQFKIYRAQKISFYSITLDLRGMHTPSPTAHKPPANPLVA
jgi:hypothetical protein